MVHSNRASLIICSARLRRSRLIRYGGGMDQVQHPIDWWAEGGYQEVIRNTGWNRAKARRQVRRSIRAYGWNPIGRHGYEKLRRDIMDGKMLDRDLV